jgi:osmotically-inducible protein OsmY
MLDNELGNEIVRQRKGAYTLPDGLHLYAVPDDELAKRVAHVLIWNILVPPNAIRVAADKGRITLTGNVEWEYQRAAAEDAVRPLCGVVAVINNVTLTPRFPARVDAR